MRKTLVNRWLSRLFQGYLQLVSATAKIEVKNTELIKENTIIGYWHGDSYSMMLILQEIVKNLPKNLDEQREQQGMHGAAPPISVIVTADARGDYIENILMAVGAKAIRLPDGVKMRRFLRDLEEMCAGTREVLAASLDGPLGPLHEPKKLLFRLACQTGKEMCYAYMQYSRVLRLKYRWDKYCIPLPFTTITAHVEHLGLITKNGLDDFPNLKSRLKVS